MRTELIRLLSAVQFFTRIPVPAWVGHSPTRLNEAARYFPWVGALVGAMVAGITLAAAMVWSAPIAVTLGMVASLLLTGGFHEDGLTDSVDALGGAFASDRARTLAIMKDSRIGAYGAMALVMALLLKWQVLAALLSQQTLQPLTFFVLIVAAHTASRWVAVALITRLNYVRDEPVQGDRADAGSAKAKPITESMNRTSQCIAAAGLAAAAIAAGWVLGAPYAVALLLAAIGLQAWLAGWYNQRVGGYTGDLLGAAQQLSELTFYLLFLVKLPEFKGFSSIYYFLADFF